MATDKTYPLDALDAFFEHWGSKVAGGVYSPLNRAEMATLGMFAMWLEEQGYELVKRGEHGTSTED